jgi:anti-anti-sigma factor
MAMHELRISVDVRPGAAVVSVVGDVSAVNIDPFRKGLADAIARKQPRTVVDLSQTTFLSSPGLAVLVQGLQLSQRGGSQLYLAAANDRVRGIFEIARLTEVFRMVPTVDAALEA